MVHLHARSGVIKWNRGGIVVSGALIPSPEPRSSMLLTMSSSVTVKDKEETEKDDRSHRGGDNSCCPSSIILAIGIVLTNIGATTTIGSNRGAGRIALALLVEWVYRIVGMRDCDLAGTGSIVGTTR